MRNECWRLVLVSMGKKIQNNTAYKLTHGRPLFLYAHTLKCIYIYKYSIIIYVLIYRADWVTALVVGGGGTTEDICTSSYKETRHRRMVFFFLLDPPQGIFSPLHTRSCKFVPRIVHNNMYFMLVVYIIFIAF